MSTANPVPTIQYPHLQLSDWPFRIEPDESFSTFLADRTQLRIDIASLLRNLSRRTPSSIHLMWAWFGAGKTHTLRYLSHVARRDFINLVPLYTVFPKATKGFLDLYQLTISKIEIDVLIRAFEEIYTHKDGAPILRKLHMEFPDLSLVLHKLLGAPEAEQDICIRWLRGGELDKSQLKKVGLGKAITRSEEAITVFCSCIELCNSASTLNATQPNRFIWLIDEYQRIKSCRTTTVRDEINTAVHSIITRLPRNLSVIISFSGRPEEKKWPEWLSPEIRDRIGLISNVLLLPPLSRDEGTTFVRDVLAHLRPANSSAPPFFPFTEEAVGEILKLMQHKKVEIKPRAIMQFFGVVLEEADTKIEAGAMSSISATFVRETLKQYVYRETAD